MNQTIRERLERYHALLLKWQKAVNLVAPSTLEDAWSRHFEDSLQLLDLLPASARSLVDLGSGAGFPGLVLAIARPDLAVHLIESDRKKGAFLLAVSRETCAQNVYIFEQRIETVLPSLSADVITARALAPLSELLRLTKPQWNRTKQPASLLFLKGEKWQEEVEQVKKFYNFDFTTTPSRTNPNATILCISAVHDPE